jgi:uncharacterized protein YjbJ (UPF0337 family)
MNRDRIEGNWTQIKGNVKQQWSKLTDYQMDLVADKRCHLACKIHEIYIASKGEAEKQLSDWQKLQKDMTGS